MRFHIKNGDIIVIGTNNPRIALAAAKAYGARIWDTKHKCFVG